MCAWHGLCQTLWEEVSLRQLTAVPLALSRLSAFPFCSKSPGSRWRAACGSISLTCMSLLAPRLGRGGWPVCLTLFQEHIPALLSLESRSRNRIWQVSQTPTNTHGEAACTCRHPALFTLLGVCLWTLQLVGAIASFRMFISDFPLIFSVFYLLVLTPHLSICLSLHKVLEKTQEIPIT